MAVSFVYPMSVKCPLSIMRKRSCNAATLLAPFSIAGFSVVRRHSVPSGLPLLLHSFQVFLLLANTPAQVRHTFRILGASHTSEMTLTFHGHYTTRFRSCQWKISTFQSFFERQPPSRCHSILVDRGKVSTVYHNSSLHRDKLLSFCVQRIYRSHKLIV